MLEFSITNKCSEKTIIVYKTNNIISSSIDLANSLEYQSGTLTQILYPSAPLHILADTHVEDSQIALTQVLTGFVNEPQIIYSVYRMNFENAVSGGYTFSITSQSPSSFTITVVAPTVQKIYNVWIKWLAFVDRNKQAIAEEIITPQNSETFTETHFNKNFIIAVPIINYLAYTSSFTFKFDMPAVDTTNVQIVFTSTGLPLKVQSTYLENNIVQINIIQLQWAPASSTLNLSPYQISSVQIPHLQQSDNLNFPIFLGLMEQQIIIIVHLIQQIKQIQKRLVHQLILNYLLRQDLPHHVLLLVDGLIT